MITKNNVGDYFTESTPSVTIGPDMILTQGAIDILRNKGIAIHYGTGSTQVGDCKLTEALPQQQTLKEKIEAVLKEEYNISQREAVQEIIAGVLKRI